MRWSYTVGRIAGTEVKVHATFILLLAWVGYTTWADAGLAAAAGDTFFFLLFFLCILLHEFGHITMARRFGVRTPDVILLPIGGVARLERIPEVPGQELRIAIAGPAVTVGIIVLLAATAWATGHSLDLRDPLAERVPFILRLLVVNGLVLGFNLIPAFPLDGGRVLRALLASRLGLVRATRIAGTIGQVFAVVLGIFGFLHHEPLVVLVAFFIFLGAGSESASVSRRAAGRRLQVAQLMLTRFRTVPAHYSLQQAADLLLADDQKEFPVVDDRGHALGLLTRDDLIRGLSRLGPAAGVTETMSAAPAPILPTLGFSEAVERLRASGLPALPVVDGAGTLVGLLTLETMAARLAGGSGGA